MTSIIDIDAIPLDLPRQERQPIATLYMATVATLPDGREVVMPHHGEPVWQWFGKRAPTSAHGPRGQAELKGTSSGEAVGDVGERGRPRSY
ncbi:MAG: hypothetical protein FJ288_16765 [Planctomycetes bacterium]|nr:hypothetical protein [Planctomycetota bacterium]